MGTKVHLDSYFPHAMRDLSDDFDSSSWPVRYGESSITSVKYYGGFSNKTTRDSGHDYDRDALRRRMLEHDAIFKSQLCELHRLYKNQREMMEEAKKERQISIEQSLTSSSSPLFTSGYVRTSSLSCTREYNGPAWKECDALDSRPPSKVRKKMFDLQLPPEKNSISEEVVVVDLNQPIRVGVEAFPSSMQAMLNPSLDENWAQSNQKRATFDSSSNSAATVDRSLPPSAAREPKSYLNHDVRKREIDIDLNEAVDEEDTTRDDRPASPWLKEVAGNAGEVGMKKEMVEAKTATKILGIPIFDAIPHANKESKKRMIDINLECDDDDDVDGEVAALEKENRSEFLIDLNSCAVEGEDTSLPSSKSTTQHSKRVLEIDLEAPPLQESDYEDYNTKESAADEALRNAAETIFTISSSHPREARSETSLPDSLLWFADIVSSSATDEGSPEKKSLSSEDIDDFEATTLQLGDMKEEEGYTPRPFVPEVRELDEIGRSNYLVSRSRRGHSRRGRQRKDFRRDILPGLATLSRHEVTEDIQTFGGLMRARGHHWSSGLTRRKCGSRGRPRAASETSPNAVQSRACAAIVVQKLGSAEPALEDRSLTGWGKTTRRPRRQRCQAGNNPLMAVLT